MKQKKPPPKRPVPTQHQKLYSSLLAKYSRAIIYYLFLFFLFFVSLQMFLLQKFLRWNTDAEHFLLLLSYHDNHLYYVKLLPLRRVFCVFDEPLFFTIYAQYLHSGKFQENCIQLKCQSLQIIVKLLATRILKCKNTRQFNRMQSFSFNNLLKTVRYHQYCYKFVNSRQRCKVIISDIIFAEHLQIKLTNSF